MIEIVIATNNKHKLEEFRRMLSPRGINVLSLSDIGFFSDIPENGSTFSENAYIKAKTVYDFCGKITVSDDSGLEVDKLGGAPGIFSARYAGENAVSGDNIKKLLAELGGVEYEKRTASFLCTICCVVSESNVFYAHGRCYGHIINELRGSDGFGYDPVFFCDEYGKTFAELADLEKDTVSHRGVAMKHFFESFIKIIDK